jgi:hypothetical protein
MEPELFAPLKEEGGLSQLIWAPPSYGSVSPISMTLSPEWQPGHTVGSSVLGQWAGASQVPMTQPEDRLCSGASHLPSWGLLPCLVLDGFI